MSVKRIKVQVKRVAPPPAATVRPAAVATAARELEAAVRPTKQHASKTALPPRQRRRNPHSGYLAFGAMLMVLAFFQMGTRSERAVAASPTPQATSGVYDASRAADLIGASVSLPDGQLSRPNPNISALEMFFCRGRQTSTGCSHKVYHPYLRWWETFGDDPKMGMNWKLQAAQEITRTFGSAQDLN